MMPNSIPKISRGAITLIDAQNRISDWRTRVKDAFGTTDANTPISIFIPYSDLENIVTGFQGMPDGYFVTGARLYLTFSDSDLFHISGVLVPVGCPAGIIDSPKDILLDVSTGKEITVPVDPSTRVSVYDFTHPCPPLGCEGASSLLTGIEDDTPK